jgi:hypothetical protein
VGRLEADHAGAASGSTGAVEVGPAAWSPWAGLSDPNKTQPGNSVTAVSTVPGGTSLFVVDPEGAIQTSYFDPRQ